LGWQSAPKHRDGQNKSGHDEKSVRQEKLRPWSMIRKSGNRFSEKIMLKQNAGAE